MDWARAITINRTALTRIVAMLITMVAGYETLVPKPIYHAVLRVLYPAESAVRRLIVMAARGAQGEGFSTPADAAGACVDR
jgi:hypothetical protein